jgi:hypothetical protein
LSTIRVDNFGPSAGGTTYSARGIAKAWVNFNGTGTIAARDSENVSSLTDNGTGDYTANIGNDFAAADYAISNMVRHKLKWQPWCSWHSTFRRSIPTDECRLFGSSRPMAQVQAQTGQKKTAIMSCW